MIVCFNPIHDGFFGAAHGLRGGGGQKGPPPKKISYIFYTDETWHSYILPKEDPNNIYPLSSADIKIFHRKSATFVIFRKTDIDCTLIHNF